MKLDPDTLGCPDKTWLPFGPAVRVTWDDRAPITDEEKAICNEGGYKTVREETGVFRLCIKGPFDMTTPHQTFVVWFPTKGKVSFL